MKDRTFDVEIKTMDGSPTARGTVTFYYDGDKPTLYVTNWTGDADEPNASELNILLSTASN